VTTDVTKRGFYDTMINLNLSRLGKWTAAAAFAFALALGAAPSLAQEISPDQLALARKYVDLTNKAQIFEAILAQTAAQTSKLLSEHNPDITDKIDATIGKVLETYKGKSDELFNQIARIYAVSFTPDELQQIVTFYETPAGQKLATNAFDINRDAGKVMQVYAYNFGTEFVTKVRAELKAQGLNP
jgi:hypothetical protein